MPCGIRDTGHRASIVTEPDVSQASELRSSSLRPSTCRIARCPVRHRPGRSPASPTPRQSPWPPRRPPRTHASRCEAKFPRPFCPSAEAPASAIPKSQGAANRGIAAKYRPRTGLLRTKTGGEDPLLHVLNGEKAVPRQTLPDTIARSARFGRLPLMPPRSRSSAGPRPATRRYRPSGPAGCCRAAPRKGGGISTPSPRRGRPRHRKGRALPTR